MFANEKRHVAAECLKYAFIGDLQSAAKIRQRAYAIDPPGSIGMDWSDWESVWLSDSKYINFLNQENFSDLENSDKYITSLKGAIFVDYLFNFMDNWSVQQHKLLHSEEIRCPALESFLKDMQWDFNCVSRLFTYTDTKKQNITAKMYYSSSILNGYDLSYKPKIFEEGEYNLGFDNSIPQRVIDGRRKFLETYDQFLELRRFNIDKFPKTFQTFQKHKLANSEKYNRWIEQYNIVKNNSE